MDSVHQLKLQELNQQKNNSNFYSEKVYSIPIIYSFIFLSNNPFQPNLILKY